MAPAAEEAEEDVGGGGYSSRRRIIIKKEICLCGKPFLRFSLSSITINHSSHSYLTIYIFPFYIYIVIARRKRPVFC